MQQNNANNFFRGKRRYQKNWWHWLFRYRYLYLIFDFTIEENNIKVVSNWYEGDINIPIANQNEQPVVPEQYLLNESNFHNQIELIIKRNKQ